MTKEPYNPADPTATQTEKWQRVFTHLNLVPINAEKDIDISAIRNAVVIFHAVWSGYSHQFIPKILATLNSLQTQTVIYIVNSDNVPMEFVKSLLGKTYHGYGEAVYLVNGKVVAEYTNRHTFETFLDYLKINIKD